MAKILLHKGKHKPTQFYTSLRDQLNRNLIRYLQHAKAKSRAMMGVAVVVLYLKTLPLLLLVYAEQLACLQQEQGALLV